MRPILILKRRYLTGEVARGNGIDFFFLLFASHTRTGCLLLRRFEGELFGVDSKISTLTTRDGLIIVCVVVRLAELFQTCPLAISISAQF